MPASASEEHMVPGNSAALPEKEEARAKLSNMRHQAGCWLLRPKGRWVGAGRQQMREVQRFGALGENVGCPQTQEVGEGHGCQEVT